MYDRCPACVEARASGDFEGARRCHRCKGTGIVRDPKSYVCNRCGGSLAGDADMGFGEQYGLVEASVSGGYSSPHLFDCTTYTFSLCEKCLRQLFAKFEVPPAVSSSLNYTGEAETYDEDLRHYNYRLWRKQGCHIERLKLGNCNAIIDCEKAATLRKFCSGSLTNDCSCDEHGPLHTYANTWTVPFADLAGIVDGETMTLDDKRRVALVWLLASSRGDECITHHKHAADCVSDLTGVDGNTTSMLWIPTALQLRVNRVGQNDLLRMLVVKAKEHGDVKVVEFAEGLLVLGTIKGLTAALKRTDVRAAKILPNLPDHEDEDG